MLRATALLVLAFSAALLLIGMTPHEHSAIRALLFDGDRCPSACLLSIQPGVTGFNEAVQALAAHPWVDQFQFRRGMALDSGLISWTWKRSLPVPIDSRHLGTLWVEDGRVQWVEVYSTVTLGDLWLTLDTPTRRSTSSTSLMPARVLHLVAYFDRDLLARAEVFCPARLAAFWRAPVVIRFGDVRASLMTSASGTLPRWLGCGAS